MTAANGIFEDLNGLVHPVGPPVGVTQANRVIARDAIQTTAIFGSKPTGPAGKFTRPIPWYCRIGGGPVEFVTLVHLAVSDAAGTTTQSKGGASKTFLLTDATVP